MNMKLVLQILIFQSTLPAWGATLTPREKNGSRYISIHAPRMGSDERGAEPGTIPCGISIHAPRMGSDWAILWLVAG